MKKSWLCLYLFIFFAPTHIFAKKYDLNFDAVTLSDLKARESNLTQLQTCEEAKLYNYSTLLASYHDASDGEKLIPEGFSTYLDHFYAFHASLQESYDEAYLLRHALLMQTAWQDFQIFQGHLTPSQAAKTEALRIEIVRNYDAWLSVRDQLGGSEKSELDQHRKRHLNFSYFFIYLAEFYESFYDQKPNFFSMYEQEPYALYARRPANLFSTVFNFARRLGVGLEAATVLVPAAADLAFPTIAGSFYIPFSRKVDLIVGLKASLANLKTSYFHRENLPDFSQAGPKDFFLMLPSHHVGTLDAALLAMAQIPKYMVFSKPTEAVPGFLAPLLANHPQFISVGTRPRNGASAVEQLEAALESRQSNIAVNFCQGHLEPNQTLGINGAFSRDLIKRLNDKDYNIRVVPMKWHTPSPFPFNTFDLPANFPIDHVVGEFLPELPVGLLKLILAKEFEEREAKRHNFFGIMLRSIWLSQNVIFPDLSAEEMLKRVKVLKPDLS